MKKYKCILFDLDHTLWDYETNSREALSELYRQFGLGGRGVHEPDFLQTFYVINNELWDLYDRGLLHRDVIRNERFHRILMAHGVDDYPMSLQFSHAYLENSPKKKSLMDGCVETLDYLLPKYSMVIVTNGFVVTVDRERRVFEHGAVAIDGADADMQNVCDLPAGLFPGDQFEDVPLRGGQVFQSGPFPGESGGPAAAADEISRKLRADVIASRSYRLDAVNDFGQRGVFEDEALHAEIKSGVEE